MSPRYDLIASRETCSITDLKASTDPLRQRLGTLLEKRVGTA